MTGYPVIVTPAFWDSPDWFNDGRDNPRDLNYEPFWMRRPARRLRGALRFSSSGTGYGLHVKLTVK